MKIKTLIIALLFSYSGFSQDSLSTDTSKNNILYIQTHGFFVNDPIENYKPITNDSILLKNPMKEMFIENNVMNLNHDSNSLIVLSLIDSDSSIINNWDEFTQKFTDRTYLILVTSYLDKSKLDFQASFNEQRNKGFSIKESYNLSVRKYKKTYPNLLHYLNINE